ncbi:MAG: hypothetical protein JWN70_5880 [Planctomycetaceae bacterium]|nr:hypothetical protein [Planctomycetaceae bacterium]
MRIKDLIKELDQARGELGDFVVPERLAELVETIIDEQRMIFDMSDPSGSDGIQPDEEK